MLQFDWLWETLIQWIGPNVERFIARTKTGSLHASAFFLCLGINLKGGGGGGGGCVLLFEWTWSF